MLLSASGTREAPSCVRFRPAAEVCTCRTLRACSCCQSCVCSLQWGSSQRARSPWWLFLLTYLVILQFQSSLEVLAWLAEAPFSPVPHPVLTIFSHPPSRSLFMLVCWGASACRPSPLGLVSCILQLPLTCYSAALSAWASAHTFGNGFSLPLGTFFSVE